MKGPDRRPEPIRAKMTLLFLTLLDILLKIVR